MLPSVLETGPMRTLARPLHESVNHHLKIRSLLQEGIAVIVLHANVGASSATAFGCSDSLIADDWRQAILDYHNKHRKTVAEGKQASGGGKMPGAKDMNKLYWDCNIENIAYLRNCNGSFVVPSGFAEMSKAINLGGANCDIKKRTIDILNTWWNEVKSTNLSTPNYDETKIKNFGIMAYGKTTGFACTYNKACSSNLLCVYDQKPEDKKPLYTTGDICSDNDCGQGKTCVAYLCQPKNGYTPSEKAHPMPLCTSGKDDGMTNEMQVTAVNMMNYYRRLVGTGWAQDLKGYAPIAKGLVRMNYNCDVLGEGAKTIADKCDETQYLPLKGRTLSYHIVNQVNVDKKTLLKEAIKKWADQSKLVDLTEIGGGVFYQNELVDKASDWAKIVYHGNSFVGCTVRECKNKFTVAMCQYVR
ncbi:hypothetical protein Y032_0256g357 [Ancylostoma ceylanicum]|uniref:SCP domain-containing protein n=1 Tax=Ancylostoma ceylanicum TaxID=53326 RepID=A0A016SB14_9BILA|nr:hypothetical protein Y032_0256g357 [Ancylostoma ceylanicum]